MNRIKDLRKQKQMTQLEVGEYLNVANTTISMYEKEARQMDSVTICKLCDLFGCTADYLLGRSTVQESLISDEDNAFLKAFHSARAKDRLIIDTILSEYRQK